MEYLHGLTADSTLVTGPKEDNQVKANRQMVMAKLEPVFGRKEEESSGLIDNNDELNIQDFTFL